MGQESVRLEDLIGAIYDAVLEPALWPETLERIRLRFNLHNALMGLTRLTHEPTSIAIAVNIPDQYLVMQGAEYNSDILRLWGGPEKVARYPLEEPRSLMSVTDFQTLQSNRYYLDFGAPQGLDDMVAIVLTRDRRQVGNIGFGRHRDFGPVTEDVIDGLRTLSPHLRRAALITGILEEERKSRSMLEAVLAAIRSSVVLVDLRGRVIYANSAAKIAMEAGSPMRSEHGMLDLIGEVVPGHLQIAIHAAAEGDLSLGRRGIAIPGTRSDGSPYVAHVLPLFDRNVRSGLPGEAIAAVFVADRDEDPQFISDAATMIYGLTPTEARVFELIIAGHSSAEMAKLLTIAPSTLKSHTLKLFDKTGQHRRSDLVRLAATLRSGR